MLNVHGPCASHIVPGTALMLCVCECSQQCIQGRMHALNRMWELQFVWMFSGYSPSSVIESPAPSPAEITKTFFHLLLHPIYALIQLHFRLSPKLTTEVSDKPSLPLAKCALASCIL